MRRLKVLAAAAFIAAFFLSAVQAQNMPCFNDSPLPLLKKNGEELIAQGITSAGFLMLVFANLNSGAYSIILIPPNDPVFCFGGAGHSFDLIKTKTGNDI